MGRCSGCLSARQPVSRPGLWLPACRRSPSCSQFPDQPADLGPSRTDGGQGLAVARVQIRAWGPSGRRSPVRTRPAQTAAVGRWRGSMRRARPPARRPVERRSGWTARLSGLVSAQARGGVGRGSYGQGLDRAESRADVCQLRLGHVERIQLRQKFGMDEVRQEADDSAVLGTSPAARPSEQPGCRPHPSARPSDEHPSREAGIRHREKQPAWRVVIYSAFFQAGCSPPIRSARQQLLQTRR